tara:strand:- start:11651 stop:12058 length:408 start_codon:yes stop_codon:yes gene_type:complete
MHNANGQYRPNVSLEPDQVRQPVWVTAYPWSNATACHRNGIEDRREDILRIVALHAPTLEPTRIHLEDPLILDELGVGEETIVNDYLLTNKYLPIEKELARLSKEFSDHSGSAISAAALRLDTAKVKHLKDRYPH